ncbi:MAG: hypothetical protein ABJN96_16465 [Marinomonas sp.]
MYNFFNVQSPLQMLSAISAAEAFNTRKKVLLINLSKGNRKENDTQIVNLIDYNFWDEVIIHRKGFGPTRKILRNIRLVILKLKYQRKIDTYFFGEFRDFNMAVLGETLKPLRKVLLDDGAFTITAQNKYIRNNIFPFSHILENKKSRKYKSIFINYSFPNLYSFFKLKMVSDQVNYFNHSDLSRKSVELLAGEIYFFGSKFYERNNMDLDDELSVISRALEKYKGYKVFYIPHRDESDLKLKRISELVFQVKNLGKPAEIFFEETKFMPEIIISYFSTVLYTCYIKFSNVSIVSLDVENDLKNEYWRDSAKSIYEYYRELGIPILKV